MRNLNRVLDDFTDKTAQFLGSWLAVFIHVIWFSLWLILKLDINTLTLYVSLEAIFIGIFLLMAANRAEKQREQLHSRDQAKVEAGLEIDVDIDKKQEEKLDQILKVVSNLKRPTKK